MTNRLAAGLMAASLAAGVLVGAAGTIVVREMTASGVSGWSGMNGSTGMAGMMQMMGGAMMDGSGALMPRSSPGPWHDQHHPAASPEPIQ